MFEKLLAFLLHAKAGAVSGILLLGATGALVTVSTSNSNGVTTITITQASASPTTSGSPALFVPSISSPTISSSPSPTPSSSPSSSRTACAAEAHKIADQVKRVDRAFREDHHALMELRETRDRETVENADRLLREIRRDAVKAIHQTRTCHREDKDNDKDEDDAMTGTTVVTVANLGPQQDTDEDHDGDHQKNDKTPVITFTSTTDPVAIADQAIAAMQATVDSVKNAPAKTPRPESTRKPDRTRGPEPTRSPKGQHP
jgi:hypothetical protein